MSRDIPGNLKNFLTFQEEVPLEIRCVEEEASTRRYSRISYDSKSLILCEDENFQNSGENFIEVQKFLKENHFDVPEILKVDKENNWMLLSDEGLHDLTFITDEKKFVARIKEAMDILLHLHKLDPIPLIQNRSFDYKKFSFELNYFTTGYANFRKKHKIGEPIWFGVIEFFDTVNLYLSKFDNKVICHRDFHARNLLENSRGRISMIDFQDMMMGTPQYDLVSILYDAYRPISKKTRKACYDYFKERSSCKNRKFREVFFTQALQRSFKALGTYIVQFSEKGKLKYKKSLFQCLENLEEIIQEGFFPNSIYLFVDKLKIDLQNSEIFES